MSRKSQHYSDSHERIFGGYAVSEALNSVARPEGSRSKLADPPKESEESNSSKSGISSKEESNGIKSNQGVNFSTWTPSCPIPRRPDGNPVTGEGYASSIDLLVCKSTRE